MSMFVLFLLMIQCPPSSTLFPYTTLFRSLVDGEIRPMSPASRVHGVIQANLAYLLVSAVRAAALPLQVLAEGAIIPALKDRKSTRLNSSHTVISYAVFCLKKKKTAITRIP